MIPHRVIEINVGKGYRKLSMAMSILYCGTFIEIPGTTELLISWGHCLIRLLYLMAIFGTLIALSAAPSPPHPSPAAALGPGQGSSHELAK